MKIVRKKDAVVSMPTVVADNSLNQLDEIVLFPEKVKKAKETIEKIGLPVKIHAGAK